MAISYEEIVKKCVGPKLAYHGFKYNEDMSSSQVGRIAFSRTYWCKLQYIIISRVSYDLEDVARLTSEYDDLPREIPEVLISEEPDFKLWLSNRYISALVGQEYGGLDITRGGLGDYRPFQQLAASPPEDREAIRRELRQRHQWWRFDNEADFRKVLRAILEIILAEGLDWFEEQVADIRRYHEKLDKRRKVESKKRAGKLLS